MMAKYIGEKASFTDTEQSRSSALGSEAHEKDEARLTIELLWRVCVLAMLNSEGRRRLAEGDASVLEVIPEEPVLFTEVGQDDLSAPSISATIGPDRETGSTVVQMLEVKWLTSYASGKPEVAYADLELVDLDDARIFIGSNQREIKAGEAREAMAPIIRLSGVAPEELDRYNPFDKQG